ncbi:Uu.00g048870.m01.CDS01 [Anthostomella pinea]|uniref:Uu.00g048870.m01.CDS01 n=1 Tax=Anthostomella pinea TaxID=933095 RepID=A0AAI8YCB8_9PEZI|nr:Uu.00g048870.m01.CDS01 [Anthostomella pinea]
MSFSNPRRTAVTRPGSDATNGLKPKTNLALRKGATFHSPMTPPSSPPSTSTFRVPLLPRRSQTNLDDVVDAHVRRAALTIGNIDDTLTSTVTSTDAEPSTSRRSFRDDSLPIPRGVLNHTVITDTMSQELSPTEPERRMLRPRQPRSSRIRESDSGLGTSIASTAQKRKETTAPGGATTLTRSANASKTDSIPRLGSRAVNRIHEHTLKPLLAKTSLKEFLPIVLDCPRRIQENQIVCLRDLEKTLIFMAPERAKSAKLYLDFCLTSIRCIQATVEYLSDREQTRPHDRPYSNGYFIDLVEQIRQHAQQLQEARERQASGEELDEMDVDPTDEVKLMGGLTANGRPAELVRVKKNGKAISIATGQVVENIDEETKGPIRFKRSMSQQAEDEEEIMRSMARRKKNASPEELAPKKCTHPGCTKEFKRPCDLTKHEKTHSRPWKCPHPTCKFHEYGWPTEKEMGRHVNDKHLTTPAMYECEFKPCPYKSKRESNCKQHMEKAHGWVYNRTKAPKKGSKAGSSAHPTPIVNNLPTPSSDYTDPVMTPPEDSLYAPYTDPHLFPAYPSSEEFNTGLFEQQPFDGDIQLEFQLAGSGRGGSGTPSTDGGHFTTYPDLSPEFTGQFEDIYGAHVQVPTPAHSVYNKATLQIYPNFATDMCPPVEAPHISPGGHGNTMLYTPDSMVDVDEGFDDYTHTSSGQHNGDFLLFPPNDMGKPAHYDPTLFGNVAPSLAAGYTQPSSQDFNMEYNPPPMDWASEYPNHSQGYAHHP